MNKDLLMMVIYGVLAVVCTCLCAFYLSASLLTKIVLLTLCGVAWSGYAMHWMKYKYKLGDSNGSK